MQFHSLDSEEVFPGDSLFSSLKIHLNHGQLMVLTGPNGSGKSTLLRLLARRAGIEAGTAGKDLCRSNPWPESVHGDVSVGFYLPQIIAPEERSGGQRQRSRWEVLMEARPGMDSLLLLDEPFRHLDQEFRLRALTFLEGLRCHMLIVSHDLDLLERADSILH